MCNNHRMGDSLASHHSYVESRTFFKNMVERATCMSDPRNYGSLPLDVEKQCLTAKIVFRISPEMERNRMTSIF